MGQTTVNTSASLLRITGRVASVIKKSAKEPKHNSGGRGTGKGDARDNSSNGEARHVLLKVHGGLLGAVELVLDRVSSSISL